MKFRLATIALSISLWGCAPPPVITMPEMSQFPTCLSVRLEMLHTKEAIEELDKKSDAFADDDAYEVWRPRSNATVAASEGAKLGAAISDAVHKYNKNHIIPQLRDKMVYLKDILERKGCIVRRVIKE